MGPIRVPAARCGESTTHRAGSLAYGVSLRVGSGSVPLLARHSPGRLPGTPDRAEHQFRDRHRRKRRSARWDRAPRGPGVPGLPPRDRRPRRSGRPSLCPVTTGTTKGSLFTTTTVGRLKQPWPSGQGAWPRFVPPDPQLSGVQRRPPATDPEVQHTGCRARCGGIPVGGQRRRPFCPPFGPPYLRSTRVWPPAGPPGGGPRSAAPRFQGATACWRRTESGRTSGGSPVTSARRGGHPATSPVVAHGVDAGAAPRAY